MTIAYYKKLFGDVFEKFGYQAVKEDCGINFVKVINRMLIGFLFDEDVEEGRFFLEFKVTPFVYEDKLGTNVWQGFSYFKTEKFFSTTLRDCYQYTLSEGTRKDICDELENNVLPCIDTYLTMPAKIPEKSGYVYFQIFMQDISARDKTFIADWSEFYFDNAFFELAYLNDYEGVERRMEKALRYQKKAYKDLFEKRDNEIYQAVKNRDRTKVNAWIEQREKNFIKNNKKYCKALGITQENYSL